MNDTRKIHASTVQQLWNIKKTIRKNSTSLNKFNNGIGAMMSMKRMRKRLVVENCCRIRMNIVLHTAHLTK